MNSAYQHLLVNHLPILGSLFGLGLILYGLAWRQDAVIRAALGLFVVVAVGGGLSDWTGGKAEPVLEGAVPTVSHAAIHEHEEMGEKAAWGAYALGALALVTLGLGWGGRDLRPPLVYGTVALALVVAGLMGYTGKLGGEIRHTEEIHHADGTSVEAATERAAPARDGDG